tara:strand:+ start:1067 stop:1363 length:297 start_codon:yes stop_codon:yes gene_type:complete
MEYKRAFCFGCSWTHYNWPTWADILEKDLDIPVQNWGIGGLGNDWKKRVQVYAEYINNLTQDDLLQMYESQKHIIKHNHEFANKPWASENLIWVLRKL